MPVKAFSHPNKPGEIVSFDDAPGVFEVEGLMPSELVRSIVEGYRKREGDDPRFLQPSKLDPGANCRRKMVMGRFTPYTVSPYAAMMAQEGTSWHEVFNRAKDPNYRYEVQIPNEQDAAHPLVRKFEDGRYRVEVWPEVWLSGTVDRIPNLPDDQVDEITDFKSTRYTKQDRSRWQIEEWALQLSTYGHIGQIVRGWPIKRCNAWRYYRGSYEQEKTNRLLAVPFLSKDAIWARIGPYVSTTIGWLKQAHAIKMKDRTTATEILQALRRGAVIDKELEDLYRTIPRDGYDQQLFGGKMCTQYCELKGLCDRVQGLNEFAF